MIEGRLAKAINQAIKEIEAAPIYVRAEAGMVALKTAARAIAELERENEQRERDVDAITSDLKLFDIRISELERKAAP